jgi:hypothetical protein
MKTVFLVADIFVQVLWFRPWQVTLTGGCVRTVIAFGPFQILVRAYDCLWRGQLVVATSRLCLATALSVRQHVRARRPQVLELRFVPGRSATYKYTITSPRTVCDRWGFFLDIGKADALVRQRPW